LNIIQRHPRCRTWLITVLLVASAAGCGKDGKDQIFGAAGTAALAPKVSAVTPVSGATGVSTSNPSISATFNQPMAAISGGATFVVTCAAPCMSPTTSVALDATNTIATATLAANTQLAPLTLYTATVTGATSLATGLALAGPYVWQFTTRAAPLPPTVTAVAPINHAVGVPLNTAVAATFSEPVAPLTGTASFTLTCAAPCASPTGAVALDSTGSNATFTPAAILAPLTVYTATITGATSLATSVALATPYTWQFTTGVVADTTRPAVLLTAPVTTIPGPTTGVPVNSAITAAFTKNMAPASITSTSFTLTCAAPCASPAGTVSYEVGASTAVFAPAAQLAVATTYTATITTAATDLAGNALAGNQAALPAASNYIWTFTTVPAAPPAGQTVNVSVKSTNPAAGATGVCPNASVNATFTVPAALRMNPSTINAATFTLTGPAPAATAVSAASVTLDAATGTIATFTPQTALVPMGMYTATIVGGAGGVEDLAVPADDMVGNFTWNFTVGTPTGTCLAPVALGTASPFGDYGGTAGSTNMGTLTVINGDLGTVATATSSVTGFHDTAGDIYTETPANIGTVNGTIFTCTNSTTGPTSSGPNPANCSVAAQALLDAQTAYRALVATPAGTNPGANLAGLTLAPGVYTAPGGTFMIQAGDLTLDAGGNVNAVWVFQMATTLTVGGPGAAAPQSVILAGGAQAKNVFWQVGSTAIINAGGGGTMVGTIIAQAGAAFSTAGNVAVLTLNGRALSLGAAVTVVNTVINVPAP
jgi:hypothetical protein